MHLWFVITSNFSLLSVMTKLSGILGVIGFFVLFQKWVLWDASLGKEAIKTHNSCLIPKICMWKERTGSCNFWPFHMGCNGYYMCNVYVCAWVHIHRDRIIKMWKQTYMYLIINTIFPLVSMCICLYFSKSQDLHLHHLHVVIVHTLLKTTVTSPKRQ